ncbi:Cell division control protein 73 [Ceratobasidium theobromae]|uniref:Cell division control protein 73 n=1 Tax=Ceratobasidium theobromae TaxID=1582974 RepID=A0A5N5QTW2_9AGAM|nr:Cell division control protein 73 [Ceratobasidium theobromae]
MTDVLNALRDAISRNQPITFLDGSTPSTSLTPGTTHIVLSPTLTVLRNTPTRFRRSATSTATDPEANPKDFVSLEALLLVWTLRSSAAGDYVRQARAVPGYVAVTDRKGIVEWLEGKRAEHENIVRIGGASNTPPGSPRRHSPSKPTSAIPTSAPRREKREHPTNTADFEVCKRIKLQEIELRDRNSVLRGVKTNNFSNVKALLQARQKPKEPVKGAVPVTRSDTKVGAKKAKNMHPIIVIPSSPTSLITMYNVKKFLEEATFEPSEAAKARSLREGNLKAEDVIAIVRRRAETEQQVKYYIVDSVEALSKFATGGGGDVWDRVVCVLTTGQQWQFKPYKWSEPRQLFHNVKGMYIKWRNDTSQVKDWNVSTLEIDQHRRHVDKQVVASFWRELEHWIIANKPFLFEIYFCAYERADRYLDTTGLGNWNNASVATAHNLMKLSGFLVTTSLLATSVSSLWPFPAKRFKANGLISAGGLGLDKIQGRVVAFGDLDGDQFLDILVLSEDQRTVTAYTWHHDSFSYTQSTSVSLFSSGRIVNVVPVDLNYDGRLDLLLMSSSNDGKTLDLSSALGGSGSDGLSFSTPRSLPPSGLPQPIVLDSDGNMQLNLLGVDPDGKMRLWRNNEDTSGTFIITDSPLSSRVCTLADPHSSAVVDFNGDCLADIFLNCKESNSDHQTFQIWTRSPGAKGGYVLAREGSLPKGAGAVSFADMDRDGTLDLVFPVCGSFSSKTGVGLDCSIHIVYNKQIPLCTSAGGISGGGAKCRSPGALCVADDSFELDMNPNNGDAYAIIPLSDVLSGYSSLILTDTSHVPPLPLPLRLGDADVDGFPDILAVAAREGNIDRVPILLFSIPGKDAGVSKVKRYLHSLEQETMQQLQEFGHRDTRNITEAGAVRSTAAAKSLRRTFRSVKHGADALSEITDARSVAFLDLDEDGTLDILVQRNGAQTGSRVTFVQNNFFRDAFFLKAIVLNGACPNGMCEKSGSGKYKPFGAMNPGASFKYTVLDPRGQRSAAFGSQLPQTGYQALYTPYAFLGLGRTNNYIESLTVGSTSPRSATTLEGVIPNSKLVLNPGPDGADWRRELFLRPGEWLCHLYLAHHHTLLLSSHIGQTTIGMAPKGGNAKKESGRAKKAENEARKQEAAAAVKEKKIADEWSQGAKSNKAAEDKAAKKAAEAARKAENARLLEEEETSMQSAKKAAPKAGSKGKAKPPPPKPAGPGALAAGGGPASVEPEPAANAPTGPTLEEPELVQSFAATGVDDALALLEVINAKTDKASVGQQAAGLERHPERPGLRLQQYKELLYKTFQKSPDNPFNQTLVAYDATKEDKLEALARRKQTLEERLRE